jgi:hypothetical protein
MSGTDIAKIFTHGRNQVVRLRLAFRLPPYSWIGNRRFLIDGAKLRAEFVVPHAQARSFFYGLNFELSFLLNLDPVGEPATCSQDARRFDEIGREVDRRDPPFRRIPTRCRLRDNES